MTTWLLVLLSFLGAPASQPASKPASLPASQPTDDALLDDLDFLEFLQMADEAPWFVE